jgi:hypothetical protein
MSSVHPVNLNISLKNEFNILNQNLDFLVLKDQFGLSKLYRFSQILRKFWSFHHSFHDSTYIGYKQTRFL